MKNFCEESPSPLFLLSIHMNNIAKGSDFVIECAAEVEYEAD
jgi:hypothetical protein